MGLDQYAYRTNDDRCQGAFELPDADDGFEREQIAQWRKHSDLHGWMRELYREKGGDVVPVDVDEDGVQHTFMGENFNAGQGVELTAEDLDRLEKDVQTGALPVTRGFFFGESDPEDVELDRQFIAAARQAIEAGDRVFYTSWW